VAVKATKRTTSRKKPRPSTWAKWGDERLLDLKLRDLGVGIEGSVLEERLERLYDELEQKGIRLKPHAWLSTEWFSPDGVPGIAMPFYLAHPRLAQLERRQMLEVDGGNERACMRILRHEAGHAVDTAWRLHFRRSFQRVFGRSRPYPRYYKPKPVSRRYVQNLDAWYAQSHPAEDFAETFAVWLAPGSRWRQTYADWPALKKLEVVDALMGEIAGEPPRVRSRRRPESLGTQHRTLREFYAWKRDYYGTEYPEVYDRDLKRLFSDAPEHRGRETGTSFLRRVEAEVREMVAQWTGLPQYTIEQVLHQMMGRCKELKLRAHHSDRKTKMDLTVMLTVQTMNHLHSGRHRVAM
jgi:hypothetical protein